MKKILSLLLVLVLLASSVYAIDDIEIVEGSVSLEGNPGETLTGNLTLVNAGGTNLTSIFSGYALTCGLYQVDINTIANKTLMVGEDTTVWFSVPLAATQFAGDYSGILTVTAGSDSDDVIVNVDVDENPAMIASDVDVVVAQGKSAQSTFTIQNIGNNNLSVEISVSDLSDGTNDLSSSYIDVVSMVLVDYAGSEDVVVTVDAPGSQPVSTYSGKLTFTFDGKSVESNVIVEVREPVDDLVLDTASITFPETRREEFTSTETFKIKNNGDNTLTNVELDSTADDKYDVQLSKTSIAGIAPGEEVSVTISAFTPEDQDSGRKKIGEIRVSSDQDSESIELFLDTESMLEITDLDVEFNGDSQKNLDDGDTINDVKPGDTIDFDIEIKNNYDDDEDIDIEDIVVTITIKDIDDGDDFEEESVSFDLSAEEDDRVTISFDIPWEVDEDTFEVLIEVTGEDSEHNVDHDIDVDLELEISKDKHDVKIVKANVDIPVVKCNRQTTLLVTVLNTGREEEDDVSITIENSELGIDIARTGIALDDKAFDDDSKYTFTQVLDIPESVAPGIYTLILKSYYNNDKQTDLAAIQLEVQDCVSQPIVDDNDSEDEVIVLPGVDEDEFVPVTDDLSVEGVNRDIIILVLANIIVLAVIIMLVFYLFRRK